MKNVNFLSFFMTVAILFSMSCVYAQVPLQTSADSIALKESRKLKQKLQLNDEQTIKVARAMKMYHIKKSNFQMLKLNSSAIHKGRKSMLKKYRDDIKMILTNEQFVLYNELLNQRKKDFRDQAATKGMKISEIEE